MPGFSTLSRRQKGLNVAIPYRQSTGALHLLIDSTGIKAGGEGEWFAKKQGPSKPRQWRKVHLGTEEDQDLIRGIKSPTKADTLEIRAIEVTGSRVGDAPMLPELLNQIPADQAIGKVSATGPMIRGVATPPSLHAAPAPSYQRARTRGHGWRQRRALRPGTKLSAPPAALAAPSGGAGAGITDEAWSRPRCDASSCSGSESWRATSTGRSPNYKSERRS